MKNWPVVIPNPEKMSSTESTKARCGSPQRMLETGDAGSAKMPKGSNTAKTQNELLYGVGSQFPTIDDSIKNKDIHANL